MKPKEYAHCGSLIVRTPALSFSEWLTFAGEGDGSFAPCNDSDFAGLYGKALRTSESRLMMLLKRPAISEALWLASPDLSRQISSTEGASEEKKKSKVVISALKYFVRMLSRSTPFGLFSGCSAVPISPSSNFEIGGREANLRKSRLDMEFLMGLVQTIVQDDELRGQLVYRPNSSIHFLAGRCHYVESRHSGTKRTYHLMAVEDTPYLRLVLEAASRGGSILELADKITAADSDIARDEAVEFVDELVRVNLLVAQLVPPVTGEDPLKHILAHLEDTTATSLVTTLRQAEEDLASIDSGEFRKENGYAAVADSLDDLNIQAPSNHLFQVDMYKSWKQTAVSERTVREVLRGACTLFNIQRHGRQAALENFKQEFVDRYGQTEIPLLEALDDEIGIGYNGGSQQTPEPLLDDMPFPSNNQPAGSAWGQREAWLLGKLQTVWEKGQQELRLNDEDIAALSDGIDPAPPDAFTVSAVLAADGEGSSGQVEPRYWIRGVGGPSGARTTGRFCYLDPAVQELVDKHLHAEEALRDDETLFAEIVHLPEDRVGNILLRPVLRSYEIPYLGRSGAPPERQIHVSDLLLSVRGGEITLRSKSLSRVILPRMTTAHNFNHPRNLRIYTFLCDLQNQGNTAGAGWRWGVFEAARFLPRVTWKQFLFSRAMWRISKDIVAALKSEDDALAYRMVQTWRGTSRAPRFVYILEGDNELLIDFDNTLSVKMFVEHAHRGQDLLLAELFPEPGRLLFKGKEGPYVHEMNIPFTRTEPPKLAHDPLSSAAVSAEVDDTANRYAPPASQWLYARIYTGPATLDRLLLETLAPMARRFHESGTIDSWFFIRYADPHLHIRLRFHGAPEKLLGQVLPTLNQALSPLLAEKTCWDYQLGTYQREVERYGGPAAISQVERIFFHDSVACTEIISLLRDNMTDERRWIAAFMGMDALFEDFGLSLAEKLKLVESRRDGFATEFGTSAPLEKALSARFRGTRPLLNSALWGVPDTQPELIQCRSIYAHRTDSCAEHISALRKLETEGKLSRRLVHIVGSLSHMHINRLLRSRQRQQEAVLNDLLARLYKSRLAMESRQ